MTTTVLVIGGSDQFGAGVAPQQRSDGYQVRLLGRNCSRVPASEPGFAYVVGDLDSPATLRSALAGSEVVHVSVRGRPIAEPCVRSSTVAPPGSPNAARGGVGRLTYISDTLAASDAAAPDVRAKFHAEQVMGTSRVP